MTSKHKDLTRRHTDLACQNHYPTSDGRNMPLYISDPGLRGVIKKFVDWCDKINTNSAMLTDFVRIIKQQFFN